MVEAMNKAKNQDEAIEVQNNVEAIKTTLIDFADKICNLAELSLEEEQSSALLIDKLKEHGFTIDSVGTSNIPTAFTASYGSGSPGGNKYGKPIQARFQQSLNVFPKSPNFWTQRRETCLSHQ